MPTSIQNLNTAIANVDAQLAAITLTPRPNYSIDGESVSWIDYLKSLTDLREKLVAALIQAEGPTELHVAGRAG